MRPETERLKRKIMESPGIDESPKPPCPPCEEDQNYIFISYSHKDYRRVYCDLLELADAGVRFWYDAGLPAGKNWDDVVEGKIRGAHCSGVVFYLSENLFLSKSIVKEVAFAVGEAEERGERNYFCMNLDNLPPAKIFRQIVRKYSDEELEAFGIDDRIADLLASFTDETASIDYKEDGSHTDTLLSFIRERFDVMGDASPSEESEVRDLRARLDLERNFLIRDGRLVKCLSDEETVVLPEGVHTLGHNAFFDCDEMRHLVIPEGVVAIENNVFPYCENLERITFPSSLRKIGAYAFRACPNLKHIELPDVITEVGRDLFFCCLGLRYARPPRFAEYYGDYIFYGCENLEGVTLSRHAAEKMPSSCFYNCENLRDIWFEGTTAEWEKNRWYPVEHLFTVHCTDGDLTVDGANRPMTVLTYHDIFGSEEEDGESAGDDDN